MLPPFVRKPEQVWLLWHKSKAVGQRPSQLLAIENDYVAYCLDEAVIFFGLTMENMLDEAGHKPGKDERKARAARERLLNKVLGNDDQTSGYADPALMFN